MGLRMRTIQEGLGDPVLDFPTARVAEGVCRGLGLIDQRDVKRHLVYLVYFVRAPQPSFATVFGTPSHALREEEARRQPG
jgi:hypothetical protein